MTKKKSFRNIDTRTYGASYYGQWIAGNRHGSGRYLYTPESHNFEEYGDTEPQFHAPVPELIPDYPFGDPRLNEIQESDEPRLTKFHDRLFRLQHRQQPGEGDN